MSSPFIEQLRADMRLRGYSLKTEKSYLGWVRQYIFFHKKQHPKNLGSNEVREFLSWLANKRHVAINTQKTVVFRILCHFVKLSKKEMTYDQNQFRHGCRFKAVA